MTTLKLETFALPLLLVIACRTSDAADRVGDPCLPDSVPVSRSGFRGFEPSKSYVSQDEECEDSMCLVHHLDLHTGGPADPTMVCSTVAPRDPPNCATRVEVEISVYCSCRCDDQASHACRCPSGFVCEAVGDAGADPQGSYCVRKRSF